MHFIRFLDKIMTTFKFDYEEQVNKSECCREMTAGESHYGRIILKSSSRNNLNKVRKSDDAPLKASHIV